MDIIMLKELRTNIILFFVLMLITGLGYPLFILDLGQLFFPFQANGSLIKSDGKIVGSTLIGQRFVGDGYFHPRPSAAGDGYDATASAGSNLGPTNPTLLKVIAARVVELKKESSGGPVPIDLVTTSASGLDPDISPAAARFQVKRIAMFRHINPMTIDALVTHYITPRLWGILGENRVNVLMLNQALDHELTASPPNER
jgi:potassium-transporting ATPase KdpC subunit